DPVRGSPAPPGAETLLRQGIGAVTLQDGRLRVCIAGGTGFIGTALTRRWLDRGAEVTVLTRRAPGSTGRSGAAGAGGASPASPGQPTLVSWDDPAWRQAVGDADVVVNLAGATISRRWTAAYKQEILNSRLRVTRSLVEALGAADLRNRPIRPVLISGSA